MKHSLGSAFFALALAAPAFSATCGTVESPTACSITVGGNTTYTVSNFVFNGANGSGGGAVYQDGDIDIDIGTGGGNTLLMTFSKHNGSPTPGLVFLANPGNVSSFTFTYDVAISAAAAGTAAFTTPDVVSYGLSSAVGNGFSTTQMILQSNPNGTSCSALHNSSGLNQGNCNTLPAGLTNLLTVSNITTLNGGTGNTSILTMTNLIAATFTADTAPSVPEPSSLALMAAGLAAAVARAVRRG
ncbi:MAG: PEP-CTERM sorting domain-containing protein [Acidobacteria bacterium]|nr:PEP-CTERM sorting domain-containing protein [Acidobacteriota bacterium]